MGVIGIGFAIFYMMAYPRSFTGQQTFTSPRANVGYFLTQRFAEGHGFRYPLQHFQQLPTDIARALTPRDAAELDGAVVPKDFAGTMLLYGLLFVVWKPLTLVVSPLFAVLGALVVAKIGEEIFDRWVGLAAFVLWLAYPVLFANASFIIESDTISLFGVLCGFLYFCRYWRERQRRDLIMMTLAFGFSILMRYPSALVTIPLILALLIGGRIRWREAMLASVALAPFGIAVLVFNRFTYGAFLTTGYGLGDRLWSATMNRAAHSLFQFHFHVASDYIRDYLVKWPIILGPPTVGLLYGLYVAWHKRRVRFLVLILIAATLGLTLYYLPIKAYGTTRPVINASVLRYLMPALAIWTVFFAQGLYQLTGRRIVVATVVVAAIVAGSLRTSWLAPGGARDTRASAANLSLFRQKILTTTEPDSIVASAIMDKVLFPERQTLTVAYLLGGSTPIRAGGDNVWYFFPSPKRFAELAVQTYQRSIPLYVLLPPDSQLAQTYSPALREQGLRLRHVWKVTVNFYKVVTLRGSA